MSSTNRGSERQTADNYPTPAWCVHRLLEAVPLPHDGLCLEPAFGDGAIVRAINSMVGLKRSWLGVDIRPECSNAANALGVRFLDANFLAAATLSGKRFSLAITNPPYSLAQQFIERCLEVAKVTAMLLRLNYLGSAKRAAFMRANPPDVYVLPNRPAFVNGKTDSCEYAWFVWGMGGGRLRVLAPTPAAERRVR
jgi:hypothetical protein